MLRPRVARPYPLSSILNSSMIRRRAEIDKGASVRRSAPIGILKRLLLRGVGIAFYTRLGFAEELASGRLVAVPLEEEPLSTLRLCLIAPSGRLPTVAAGAMAEHLREALIRFTTDDPRDLHR